ncbi:uncharacterized protein OCT59_026003 [Rhizophagus irregularis]|uniref:uncharacterized protein n=1 Tax=Rhizophagus irregularis TaxID=588596 RepID=UPI00332C1DF8|nr:hypothetical protein OCT59_026003 [Rhizophagus irregularis]
MIADLIRNFNFSFSVVIIHYGLKPRPKKPRRWEPSETLDVLNHLSRSSSVYERERNYEKTVRKDIHKSDENNRFLFFFLSHNKFISETKLSTIEGFLSSSFLS